MQRESTLSAVPHSIRYQRCRVPSRDRQRTEFHEVGVVRGVDGEHGLSAGDGVLAQLLAPATRFGVGDQKAIAEGSDMAVASGGDSCGGAVDVVVEKRKEQESSVAQRLFPSGRYAHLAKPASRAYDDGYRASQKERQVLLFHRCLKTTHQRHLLVSQSPRQIIRFQHQIARTANGAEESDQRPIE